MSKIGIYFLVVFFILTNYVFISNKEVKTIWAASTDAIDIEVKLSVCGDSVIENPEDCEGVDLNSATCVSEGYASGDLSCTISCEFDYTDCVPLPSPTPTPTPTPSSGGGGSSGSSGSSGGSSSSSTSSTSNTTTVAITNLINTLTAYLQSSEGSNETTTIVLPDQLLQFEKAVSGLISKKELNNVLQYFAKSWRSYLANRANSIDIADNSSNADDALSECDINNDKRCDIKDFSVLLYYIDES